MEPHTDWVITRAGGNSGACEHREKNTDNLIGNLQDGHDGSFLHDLLSKIATIQEADFADWPLFDGFFSRVGLPLVGINLDER